MDIDLDQFTAEELIALNHRIVERLKMLETLQTHQAMMEFHPGARVSFEDRNGERLTGTLLKFNRKTVTVITDNGQRWNISPHLLSPIKEAKLGKTIEQDK